MRFIPYILTWFCKLQGDVLNSVRIDILLGGLLTGSKTKKFYAFCLTMDCKGSCHHSTTRSYGQCGQKSHQPAPSAFCDCVFFLLVTFQAVLFEAPITQCKNKVCFQNYDAKHLTLIRIYSIYNWKVPFILLWVGILKGPSRIETFCRFCILLSYVLLGVKFGVIITVSQSFVSSICMFLDKKTLLKTWFNPGLNLKGLCHDGAHVWALTVADCFWTNRKRVRWMQGNLHDSRFIVREEGVVFVQFYISP